MTEPLKNHSALSTVLRAAEALKNWKAVVMLGGTFLVASIITMLGGYITASLMQSSPGMAAVSGFTFALFTFAFSSAGVSGVGIMLMDQAQGIEVRGLLDAFIAGLFCVLKIILVSLIDGAFLLVFLMISAVLIFACKIPGVGPVLYTIVYPLLVLIWGVATVATILVIIPMTLPAIWEGNSIKGIYIRLLAFAQQRFMDITLALIVLAIMTGLLSSFVGVAYSSGTTMTTLISASILKSSAGGAGMAGLYQNLMGMFAGEFGSSSGYMTAAMIGGGMLFLVMLAFPFLVYLFGINLVYLGAMEGLDLAGAESSINKKIAETKRRAEEAKARAEAAGQRAREMAEQRKAKQQEATVPQSGESLETACPECGVIITDDDLFCAECGHKLK